MRHGTWLALALALGGALSFTAGALAQQMGDDAAAEEVPTRIERAERIVKALEEAKKKAYEAEALDAGYVQRLDDALEDARALTKPVTAAELTDAEKDALAEELGAGGDGAADFRQEWEDRALARAFEDAELNEQEERDATPIISEWYQGFLAARRERDAKKESDLKKERDAALKRLLGRKKANKVINNLNTLGGWGRGR